MDYALEICPDSGLRKHFPPWRSYQYVQIFGQGGRELSNSLRSLEAVGTDVRKPR